ncbi:ankyrin repeat-containing protein ITN1 [Ziziphus jujuba]|uniref:Ankyrin repeat-containing protein ITN1 n=1 Tax=Ziziphus jujuba TaxID=326968 RepID=A0ABM4AGD4_ZIZJJ|nr:ankyrin repeat-containing protein ITN1 [Ziziphus jujuba]
MEYLIINAVELIELCILEVALDLLSSHQELAITVESTPDSCTRTAVHALANLPSAFLRGCRLRFWQQWLYNCICIGSTSCRNIRTEFNTLPIHVTCEGSTTTGIQGLYDMKLVHDQTSELLSQMCEMIKNLDKNKVQELHVIEALFVAVERGNVEFVKIISTRTRQHYNMLHIAATLAPKPQLNRIPGAALQMQSELQWFQEVKSILPPFALNQKNMFNNMTPDELFTEEHKNLLIEAERWMKDTATSCTVVGALIVTIMFAAAFTVPGGNNQDSGFPIFLNKQTFEIFIISDALSLFSSTTSVLMFLGILTSRYAEQDFLKSLPRKLMFGLFALSFSIVSMMVAFCATLLLALRDRYSWIFIPLICLASIPATLFVFMQSPLLVDIFRSTYGGGIFDKKAKISK